MAASADAPQDLAGRFQLDVLALLERNASAEELTALLGTIEALPEGATRRDELTRSLQLALAFRQQLDEQQQRERGLVAVIETARDLTALRDLDGVLGAIVRRARQLVGCQIGYLASFDRHGDEFYMRATDGAVSEDLRTLRLKRGIGLIGLVERTGVPQTSSNYEPDARFPHSEVVDSIFRTEGIRSILGVPLLAGGDVIGVLFVGDRYVRAFRPWEVSILSTLAAHATVAILNAQAFEDAQAALEQASRANAQLRSQAEGIARAAAAHEELTAIVAKGGGLPELCRLVAGMLGGTVLVLDEDGHPLAGPTPGTPGSTTTGDRRVGERIRQALRESRRLGRSVAAGRDREEACRVAAIGGGAGTLGGLVIWTPSELDEFAVRIFERSAMVTGVVLLSQERTALAANADRSAILRALLSWQQQDDPARLLARAARHGVDLAPPLTLAAVEVAAGRGGDALRRLRALAGGDAVLADEVEGLLVLLAGARHEGALRTLLADGIPSGWAGRANAIVSRPAGGPGELPGLHHSLRRGLGLLRSLQRTGCVASEAELLPYAVVFEHRGERELDALLTAVVGPVLGEDQRKGSALAETLLAYLDHGRNARSTAAALGIHVNTLRQRLDTVRHLLGEWADGPRSLEIHLALRLWKLRAR